MPRPAARSLLPGASGGRARHATVSKLLAHEAVEPHESSSDRVAVTHEAAQRRIGDPPKEPLWKSLSALAMLSGIRDPC
jgi:hypothetical protein